MKRVLIAEDNPADQELIRITFEAVDPEYELEVVDDGEKLINYLETNNPYDLKFVLLDLNMPRMQGGDVLARLANDPRYFMVPIIVFSSSMRSEDIIQCYSNGANAYVRKPENLSDYHRTIEAITDFWGSINVLARPIEAAY